MANPARITRWWLWLIAIVLVAAAGRIALALITRHYPLSGDPVDYLRHGESIAAGRGFPVSQIASPGTPSAFRPPAYPFLLGGLFALDGVSLTAARLLGALLGVVSVALLGYAGRALFGARVGLLAAGLGAVFLPLIDLNATLLSESLFIPLGLGLVVCLIALSHRPAAIGWAALAGAVCAVAALTRGVADAWVLVPIAMVLTSGIRRSLKVRTVAVVLGVFVLVLAPWAVRNATVFNAFVPISTEDGFTLAGQYNPVAGHDDAFQAVWRLPSQVPSLRRTIAPLLLRPGGVNEVQFDGTLRHAALSYFVHHPGHLPVAFTLDTLRMFDLGKAHHFTTGVAYHELGIPSSLRRPTTISAWMISLLALGALLLAVFNRARRRLGRQAGTAIRLGPWWLWSIPLLTLALTSPTVGNPIKRAPLDPFLLLLAAVLIDSLLGRWRRVDGIPAQGRVEPSSSRPTPLPISTDSVANG